MTGSEAVNLLRAAGFRCIIFDGGTIGAYANGHAYGFAPKKRMDLYSEESVRAAIALEFPNG